MRVHIDPRDVILSRAYERNAAICAKRGHDYAPDYGLNGDYACGYCRAAKALTAPQDNDVVREVVRS
jgi:hypothetical protein